MTSTTAPQQLIRPQENNPHPVVQIPTKNFIEFDYIYRIYYSSLITQFKRISLSQDYNPLILPITAERNDIKNISFIMLLIMQKLKFFDFIIFFEKIFGVYQVNVII